MQRSRKSILRRVIRGLMVCVLLAVCVSVLEVVALRYVDPPTSAMMLERRWQAWRADEADFKIQYQWQDFDTVARSMPLAVIAAEDQRFAEHAGFDWNAIAQAWEHNRTRKTVRGASTISQQLAKNLFLWQGRSWIRKGLEAWYTLLLEKLLPKRRILELYVNVAEFGDGVYGVQAASQYFWRKDAAQLNVSESARLAAVLPAPKRYDAGNPSDYVRRRERWIRNQMRHLDGENYLERQ